MLRVYMNRIMYSLHDFVLYYQEENKRTKKMKILNNEQVINTNKYFQ